MAVGWPLGFGIGEYCGNLSYKSRWQAKRTIDGCTTIDFRPAGLQMEKTIAYIAHQSRVQKAGIPEFFIIAADGTGQKTCG